MVEPLSVNRFQVAEAARNVWFASLPDGLTKEELFNPIFWSSIAARLQPGDEIIAVDDAMTRRLTLFVTDVWQTGVRVFTLSEHEISAGNVAVPDEAMRIAWKGPHRRWSVLTPEGNVLRSGFATRGEAGLALAGEFTSRVKL